MKTEELSKIFSDRLYEICLLKDISQSALIERLSGDFEKERLLNCFNGRSLPNDVLLVALSRMLNTSVDSFFEGGDRVADKTMLVLINRDRKIKQLEGVLGRTIAYSSETYKKVLKDSVKEALDKELISVSKAASILGTDIDTIRKAL